MSVETVSKLKIAGSMFLFGTIGLFVRHIGLPSSVVALARGVVGMSFLVLILALSRRKINCSAVKRNLIWLLLSSAALGFNWILLFEAYRYTSVAISTLCYYMAPILIILVSPLLLQEKLTGKKILCVLTSLVGMVLISGVVQSGIPAAGELKGILFGLAAAVLYATVVMLNKQLKDIDAYDKTILQLGISAVILIPYCLLTVDPAALTLSGTGLLMLLVVGVLHTGVTYLLYFGALGHVKGQTAAILSYVDPVVAVLCSVLILAEPMGVFEAVGAVLILGAAFVSEVPLSRKKVQS